MRLAAETQEQVTYCTTLCRPVLVEQGYQRPPRLCVVLCCNANRNTLLASYNHLLYVLVKKTHTVIHITVCGKKCCKCAFAIKCAKQNNKRRDEECESNFWYLIYHLELTREVWYSALQI